MTLPDVPRRLHFLGARGQGLSALAALLADHGHPITACDAQSPDAEHDLLHRLADRLPVSVDVGNSPAHVTRERTDGLVVASYVRDDHPEIMAARTNGIVVMRREHLLGLLLRGHRTLSIAGVAGKSTTTAMAIHIARQMELNPLTFVAAYDPNRLGQNYSLGDGRTAIIEACEYREAFLNFPRDVAVITNCHWGEHVDSYHTARQMDDAFAVFASKAHVVIAGGDAYQATRRVLDRLSGTTTILEVGFEKWNDVRILPKSGGRDQTAEIQTDRFGAVKLRLPVPGHHNLLNAVMAAVSVSFWAERDGIAEPIEALINFQTLGRRLEVLTEAYHPIIIDDYAHHPAHLEAAIQTLRDIYPGMAIGIFFQPSIFRRTALLRHDYIRALSKFDRVLLQDIALGTCDTSTDVDSVTSEDLIIDLTSRGIAASSATPERLVAEWPILTAGLGVLVVCGARRTGGVARRLMAAAANR